MTPEPPPASSVPWNVIDGWIRDPRIRRDALIGLTLVLIAVVVVVCAVTGALGPLAKEAIGNTVVRIVAGSALTGGVLGYGLRLRRRRAHGARGSAARRDRGIHERRREVPESSAPGPDDLRHRGGG